MLRKLALLAVFVAVFGAGFVAGGFSQFELWPQAQAQTQKPGRVFELRTYTASGGKMEELKARFRDHTMRYFDKHGMTNIGYWTPMDAPGSQTTLVYLLSHSSRDAAKKSWAAFAKDPGWVEARTASNASGNIVAKTESVFLDATDFSQLK
ncbi:MAG: NIPSNAP family protein [Burkholderiales bacterium]